MCCTDWLFPSVKFHYMGLCTKLLSQHSLFIEWWPQNCTRLFLKKKKTHYIRVMLLGLFQASAQWWNDDYREAQTPFLELPVVVIEVCYANHTFTPGALQLNCTGWLFYPLQATHCTTGEPVAILNPTGHSQYYRKASDDFKPHRPLSVLQERQWFFFFLQNPTGHTGYFRRARYNLKPYRPHTVLQESQSPFHTPQATYSTAGDPPTILNSAGDTLYYRRVSDYFTSCTN